jgi:dTDP-4-dehydrorhamnose 3,5-epimerase
LIKVTELAVTGVRHVALSPHIDARGYFLRSYDQTLFEQGGLHRRWVQENQSFTAVKHTVRGLHFQRPPHTETKLIRVVHGEILDVFVDCRRASPTFGQAGSCRLVADEPAWLFLPPGIAHGFCSLTDEVVLAYKVDQAFNADADAGVRWNDPALNIAWPTAAPVISDKDKNLPFFADVGEIFA